MIKLLQQFEILILTILYIANCKFLSIVFEMKINKSKYYSEI